MLGTALVDELVDEFVVVGAACDDVRSAGWTSSAVTSPRHPGTPITAAGR
jgi:hypothetical protein